MMRLRCLAAFALLFAAGCRQATPAEVGTQTTRDAHPRATTMAAERAYRVNPTVVPPSAQGAPLRQPPQPLP